MISNKIDKDMNLLANTKLNENTSKDAIAYLVVENAKLIKENKQLKKQKDDVVEYIKKKKEKLHHSFDEPDWDYLFICNPDEILRMLGEIDE